MIKVYPLRKLEAQHIFKGSNGNRFTLHPAESLDDVGKTPQEFDGTDFLVATKIMECVKDKTVKVDKGDMVILNATLAAGAPSANGGVLGDAKAPTKKAIKTAVDAAVAEAATAAEEAQKTAVDAAVADLQAQFDAESKKAAKK